MANRFRRRIMTNKNNVLTMTDSTSGFCTGKTGKRSTL